MRHWLVRVLLNLGVLAGAAAIGFAGMETTDSPISFGFSVLIYFFVAWGLANHTTRGRWDVGLGAYVGPLFLTYLLISLAGMVYITALELASEIDPEAPTFAIGLPLIFESEHMLQIVGGGLGLAVVLIIPPLVAIVDRPPPGKPVEATDPAELAITGEATRPTAAASVASNEFRQMRPVEARANLAPEMDRQETLEELFGLEPGRNG